MMKRQRTLVGMLSGIILGIGLLGNTVAFAAVTDGKVLVKNMNRSPDYYIVPESQTRELADWEVKNIDEAGRQMAINEIYARHGRKFLIPEVQAYFNEKEWYKGTVEASDFDENVFNEYEEKNIATLQKCFGSEYFLDKSDSLGQAYHNLHRKSAKTIIARYHSVYRRKDLSGCFYEFIQTILVEFGRQTRNGVS